MSAERGRHGRGGSAERGSTHRREGYSLLPHEFLTVYEDVSSQGVPVHVLVHSQTTLPSN